VFHKCEDAEWEITRHKVHTKTAFRRNTMTKSFTETVYKVWGTIHIKKGT